MLDHLIYKFYLPLVSVLYCPPSSPSSFLIIILHVHIYAQQGYAFGRVCLCILRMCVYMWPKNWLFEVLPLGNLLLVQSTARSSSLTTKKGALLCLVICSEKEIRRHCINKREKEISKKMYYGKPCLVYMQCS